MSSEIIETKVKKQILKKYVKGVDISALATEFNIDKSAIYLQVVRPFIRDNTIKIKEKTGDEIVDAYFDEFVERYNDITIKKNLIDAKNRARDVRKKCTTEIEKTTKYIKQLELIEKAAKKYNAESVDDTPKMKLREGDYRYYHSRKYSLTIEQKVIEDYLNPEYKVLEILAKWNISKQTLMNILRKNNITERRRNLNFNGLKKQNTTYKIGMEVKTLAEWCDIYNIDYKIVQSRLERKWDLKKALMTPYEPQPYVYSLGKEKKTLSEWCKEYKIDKIVVKNRLRYGWGLEKALTTPVRERKNRKDQVNEL